MNKSILRIHSEKIFEDWLTDSIRKNTIDRFRKSLEILKRKDNFIKKIEIKHESWENVTEENGLTSRDICESDFIYYWFDDIPPNKFVFI